MPSLALGEGVNEENNEKKMITHQQSGLMNKGNSAIKPIFLSTKTFFSLSLFICFINLYSQSGTQPRECLPKEPARYPPLQY